VSGGTIAVTLNGAIQAPTTDYSVSGSVLTMVVAPITGAKLCWIYFTTMPATQTQTIEYFTGDGSTTDFVLVHTPAPDGLTLVALAGPVADSTQWSLIAPKTIRFTVAPLSGDSIVVSYRY
jgi:hypothetical protein